jgi:hypothetical protein
MTETIAEDGLNLAHKLPPACRSDIRFAGKVKGRLCIKKAGHLSILPVFVNILFFIFFAEK